MTISPPNKQETSYGKAFRDYVNGFYSICIEYGVPAARAAEWVKHAENAVRGLERELAMMTEAHETCKRCFAEAERAMSARGDTERLDWLETLPCGITINADRDHPARMMTRQQPGYLRDFIDEVKRSYVGEKK